MSARWDANTTQLFVRQYREKECLWNWSCSDYMDKRAREKACREIKEVMGIPGFGVGNKEEDTHAPFHLFAGAEEDQDSQETQQDVHTATEVVQGHARVHTEVYALRTVGADATAAEQIGRCKFN